MILFFYSLGIVSVLFAMYWALKAWGFWASLVVAFIGGVFIRFIPFPFGALLAAASALPVIYGARLTIFKRNGGGPPGVPVEGSSADPQSKEERGK